jgi:cytoskeleton protein RodZ
VKPTSEQGTQRHRRKITAERYHEQSPVDGAGKAALHTAAVAGPLRIPAGAPAAASATTVMEKENFGSYLRRARESADISLSEVAHRTKVARAILEVLERGDLDLMPSGVYARGFIRSFARTVGVDETEPLLLYERAVEARSAAEKTRSSTPVLEIPPELRGAATEDESIAPRRGLGLAVFVIILLVIATITLSLLLRRPPPTGEGLSIAPASRAIIAEPALPT